jgi:hypothetical protein
MGVARAEESPGERILRLMDEGITCVKDQMIEFEAITQAPGKEPFTMRLAVYTKGTKWRRVEFLAPGDLKGTRVLVLSPSQMYVYLPAYRRIRRVASHVKGQGFMGTAYSHNEMSLVTYSDVFKGRLLKETDAQWTVEGLLREGQDFQYGRVEFDVIKKKNLPSEIRYFNKKGFRVKTEIRSEYTFQFDVWNPRISKIVDHTRNDMWTKLVRKKFKPNIGLKDDFFTVRKLQHRR